MKKLLAILLVLVMVLPMCVMTNAAKVPEGTQPYFCLNWDSDFTEEFDYVYDMPFFYTSSKKAEDYTISCYGSKDPEVIAERMKEDFDTRPAGSRYMKFLSPGVLIKYESEEKIYMEPMVKFIGEWLEEFFSAYHKLGGKLDGVVLDVEYLDGNSYYLSMAADKDMYVYNKIVQHPNYKTTVRPLLEERGFPFWENVTPETPEIYSIDTSNGTKYAQARSIWDTVMRNRLSNYLDQAITEPMLKYFPDALVNDYQTCNTYAWLKPMSDSGNVGSGGNYQTTGTTSNDNTYSSRPGSGFFKDDGAPIYKNIPGYNKAEFKDNPFNMIMWDANLFKDMYAAAPNGSVSAWIAFWKYPARATGYSKTPYYSEIVYHIGMLNPTPFLGYIVKTEVIATNEDYDEALIVVDELMGELTRVAGAANRKPITIPSNWNNNFILSGMDLGTKNIFRITPDTTDGMTLKDFKVEGAKDLTFSINGQTVTFPGGKIIEDAKISKVGTCGYWVETDAGVMPTVTYAEDRYYQYPAFMETYEAYEEGTKYDLSTGQPAGCWEMKRDKDASAVVVKNGENNQMLAMKGTYTLRNTNMPKNVTAGDTYAENQAWEVEIIVPADMAADAEIVALNVFGSKTKAEEGGFKIAGGKVYYDNNGQYVELTGVDVSAGGKLRLRRELDLNTKDAYTSSYYVYDGSGKLLGEAKKVPMVAVKLPVEKIGMGVAKVAGEAVLFDNFRLYTIGVATDFEVYDAKTGIKQTDVEAARDQSTAYRLSWQNASGYEKVYSVVAAFYNGDKLVEEKVVKEVKMAPGTDAIDFGIVEVGEGQSVKLYVRNDSQPEPEDGSKPGNKPGADTSKGDDTVLLIAIIAAAVVLLAAVVVAVLMLTKKPAKKGAKKPAKKTAKKVTKDKTAE